LSLEKGIQQDAGVFLHWKPKGVKVGDEPTPCPLGYFVLFLVFPQYKKHLIMFLLGD